MAGWGLRVNYNCCSTERLNIALLSLYLFPLLLPLIQQLLFLVHTSYNIVNINQNFYITPINSDNKSDRQLCWFYLFSFYNHFINWVWWEWFNGCFWSLSKGKAVTLLTKEKEKCCVKSIFWARYKQKSQMFSGARSYFTANVLGGKTKIINDLWNLYSQILIDCVLATQSSWTLDSD